MVGRNNKTWRGKSNPPAFKLFASFVENDRAHSRRSGVAGVKKGKEVKNDLPKIDLRISKYTPGFQK